MEKRIKALYIITIIAILAFLGMQSYWLYGRYGLSLGEYEASAYKTMVQTVDEMNHNRPDGDTTDRIASHDATYRIKHIPDTAGQTKIISIVNSKKFYGHELLGIKENRPLTEEEQKAVARMILDKELAVDSMNVVYDVRNSPSDAAIWGAMKNADSEFITPLRADVAEALFREAGLDTEVELIVTDSMVWAPALVRKASVFHPEFTAEIPYSELEKKSLLVVCHIPVAQLFRDLLGSLIVVAVLSVFLIVCLVLQFATILKLTRLDRMRNGFITTMIHELKRPISTLKMCVSGMDNDRMMADGETKKEILTETRNALDNLSAYFSKLRDITFNNVEQIPLNIRTVNLRGLFDDVAAATVVPVGKTVEIINEIDGGIEVSADRSHLSNILNNLVENAVKYSGSRVEIKARATECHGAVELQVSDTGLGIPPGNIRHIFKRFYRGRASDGEQPGMGLGLAYVKLLVEAHGGEVAVESEEGKGTCFTIRLPQ